jgi:hypothetical protein
MLTVFFFMYLRAQVMQALRMRRSLDQYCNFFVLPRMVGEKNLKLKKCQ